jgi:hypothetical protein
MRERRRDRATSEPFLLGEPFLSWVVGEVGVLDFAASSEENPTVFARRPMYRFPIMVSGRFEGSVLVSANLSPLGEKWFLEGEFYCSGTSGDWIDQAVLEARASFPNQAISVIRLAMPSELILRVEPGGTVISLAGGPSKPFALRPTESFAERGRGAQVPIRNRPEIHLLE